MAVITAEYMAEVVQSLRELGVRVPEGYPPANLDPLGDVFRGHWAEVETARLLTRVVDPNVVEITGRPVTAGGDSKDGDTDVMLHLSPPYRLQVKGPFLTNVREDIGFLPLVRSARTKALRRFRADNPEAWNGVFSDLRIHLGPSGLEHSGYSFSVDHPQPVHVAVVRIESEVLAQMARKNLDRWIRGAVRQLVHYDDALLVPVLNVSRYPLNQAEAYRNVKDVFSRHPRWKDKVSGVILILRGYAEADPETGFHTATQRIVGVENPLAPSDRRLNPQTFNPDVLQETVFEEVPLVISVDPPFTFWEVRRGIVWIENTPFGALPRPLGEPFSVVPP